LRKEFGEKFGVSGTDFDKALVDLAYDKPPCTPLIRIDADNKRIILLDSGRVLVERLAASVEYLAWLFGIWWEADSQVKLDMASRAVKDGLLPAFLLEHPYMAEGTEPTKKDLERLAGYQNMFGYGPHEWFISKLASSLSKYESNTTSLSAPVSFREVQQQITNYVKRLNEAATSAGLVTQTHG
jgi:hypothetical protein